MHVHVYTCTCTCTYPYHQSSFPLGFFNLIFPAPSLPLSLPPPLPPSLPPSPDTRCYLAGGRVLSLGESAVVLTVPPSNQTRAADVILIVDESSSMTVEHAWIPDMIQQLDTALMVRELHVYMYMLYYNNYSMYKCMYICTCMYKCICSAPPKMLGAGQWQYCSFLLYIHVHVHVCTLHVHVHVCMITEYSTPVFHLIFVSSPPSPSPLPPPPSPLPSSSAHRR